MNVLIEDYPEATVFVLGDFNVGVSDSEKNGSDLLVDDFDGSGDRYDETHALLGSGLVDDLRMVCLAENLGSTYVGDDDVPDYADAGAIDVIYAVGPSAGLFSEATAASERYGSDHLAVYTHSDFQMNHEICINKLLPNPDGQDAGHETITLENSGGSVVISGWMFKDAADHVFQIPDDTRLETGLTEIKLTRNSMPLNNSGDTIRLFNDRNVQLGSDFSYSESEVVTGEEIER